MTAAATTPAPITEKEIEDWQRMMFSCRQACKITGEEYKEPDILNWDEGRAYYNALWGNRNTVCRITQ